MHTFETVVEVPVSAAQLWALRDNVDFDEHLAHHEKQFFSLVFREPTLDAAGEEVILRKIKLVFKENPVPRALRSLLKNPDLAIHTTARWYPSRFDEAHAYEYTVEPPALADRITITGKQWAVPLSESTCRFVCHDVVKVTRMPGFVVNQIERAISKGMIESYHLFPSRVREFVEAHPLVLELPARVSSAHVGSPSSRSLRSARSASAKSVLALEAAATMAVATAATAVGATAVGGTTPAVGAMAEEIATTEPTALDKSDAGKEPTAAIEEEADNSALWLRRKMPHPSRLMMPPLAALPQEARDAACSGWMLKMGSRLPYLWYERFFVFDRAERRLLHYVFKKQWGFVFRGQAVVTSAIAMRQAPLMHFSLDEVEVARGEKARGRRRLLLRPKGEEERERWLQAINGHEVALGLVRCRWRTRGVGSKWDGAGWGALPTTPEHIGQLRSLEFPDAREGSMHFLLRAAALAFTARRPPPSIRNSDAGMDEWSRETEEDARMATKDGAAVKLQALARGRMERAQAETHRYGRPALPASMDNAAMEGWLLQRSSSPPYRWQRRYFVFIAQTWRLYFFTSDGSARSDSEAKGEVRIKSMMAGSGPHELLFEVVSLAPVDAIPAESGTVAGRSWTMIAHARNAEGPCNPKAPKPSAGNPEERIMWVNVWNECAKELPAQAAAKLQALARGKITRRQMLARRHARPLLPPSMDNASMEGWLFKRTSELPHRWQRRYFVYFAETSTLHSWKGDEGDALEELSGPRTISAVQPSPSETFGLQFELLTFYRLGGQLPNPNNPTALGPELPSLLLARAPNAAERERWLAVDIAVNAAMPTSLWL